MAFTLATIFGPDFITRHIEIYAFILGAVVLVIFSDAINKHLVFPLADRVKAGAHRRLGGHASAWPTVSKYLSDGLAAAIFIVYCYLGSWVLATYIFEPILHKLRGVLILVLIGAFLLISYIINNKKARNMFLKH